MNFLSPVYHHELNIILESSHYRAGIRCFIYQDERTHRIYLAHEISSINGISPVDEPIDSHFHQEISAAQVGAITRSTGDLDDKIKACLLHSVHSYALLKMCKTRFAKRLEVGDSPPIKALKDIEEINLIESNIISIDLPETNFDDKYELVGKDKQLAYSKFTMRCYIHRKQVTAITDFDLAIMWPGSEPSYTMEECYTIRLTHSEHPEIWFSCNKKTASALYSQVSVYYFIGLLQNAKNYDEDRHFSIASQMAKAMALRETPLKTVAVDTVGTGVKHQSAHDNLRLKQQAKKELDTTIYASLLSHGLITQTSAPGAGAGAKDASGACAGAGASDYFSTSI